MTTHPEPNYDPWTDPSTSVQGRYDDERLVTFGAAANHEVVITVGDQDVVFVDSLDLLRVVSHVVLDLVHGPSPTEQVRTPPEREELRKLGGGHRD